MPPLRKVVVAMDSFKGSISSEEAGRCVAEAIRKEYPTCHIDVLCIGDGGEGTALALTQALNGTIIHTRAHDALMRPCVGYYGRLDAKTAVIDLATTCGLAQLSSSERNPRQTSSYGCGEVILEAIQQGHQHVLLCLGGSATNDAGMGLLSALGFQFCNKAGLRLPPCGESLIALDHIKCDQITSTVLESHLHILSDVVNPFCGPHGAAHVYAAQKGATADDIIYLEQGLQNFAHVVKRDFGTDIRSIKGGGAAGGIAGGCLGLLSCEISSGMEYVLEALHFEERLQGADIVITGEGKIDQQSFMGKTLQHIVEYSHRNGVSVIAFGGQVVNELSPLPPGLIGAYNIHSPGLAIELAMSKEQTIVDLSTATSAVLKTLGMY